MGRPHKLKKKKKIKQFPFDFLVVYIYIYQKHKYFNGDDTIFRNILKHNEI